MTDFTDFDERFSGSFAEERAKARKIEQDEKNKEPKEDDET